VQFRSKPYPVFNISVEVSKKKTKPKRQAVSTSLLASFKRSPYLCTFLEQPIKSRTDEVPTRDKLPEPTFCQLLCSFSGTKPSTPPQQPRQAGRRLQRCVPWQRRRWHAGLRQQARARCAANHAAERAHATSPTKPRQHQSGAKPQRSTLGAASRYGLKRQKLPP